MEDVARVHTGTLTKLSKGELDAPKRKRASAKAPKNVVAQSHIKVDPRVWKVAMRLAKRDRHRLVIKHATEVIVLNNSRKGK